MTSNRTRAGAAVLLASVICALALSVGSTHAAKRARYALSTEERLEALVRAGLDPESFVDPIVPSEEMRQMAERVAGDGTPRERLIRLQTHLFDAKNYAFDYDARRTLTAVEAFELKRGNCVSFTNLFIALGRSLDIPVHASLAFGENREQALDDLLILDSHLVATFAYEQRLLIFDFERSRQQVPIGYRGIDDAWLIAVYLNNHAIEDLVTGDLAAGRGQLETAVRLAPDFVEALSNLAVIYRRQGDTVAALDAYVLALRSAPRHPSVLSNLNALHTILSREKSGESADLLTRGDQALTGGSPMSALKLYRRAARQDPTDADAHVAVARALIVKGRIRGAAKSLRSALALDPDHASAARLLRGVESN